MLKVSVISKEKLYNRAQRWYPVHSSTHWLPFIRSQTTSLWKLQVNLVENKNLLERYDQSSWNLRNNEWTRFIPIELEPHHVFQSPSEDLQWWDKTNVYSHTPRYSISFSTSISNPKLTKSGEKPKLVLSHSRRWWLMPQNC